MIRTPTPWLVSGALGVVLAYGSAFLPSGTPAAAPYLLIGGTVALLVGLLALGADSAGRPGPAFSIFVGTALWILVGLVVVLALPAEDPATPRLVLGLPLRAAILIYGVGLAPAFVVPWAYARLFDADTLRDEDLARLRAAAARRSEDPA